MRDQVAATSRRTVQRDLGDHGSDRAMFDGAHLCPVDAHEIGGHPAGTGAHHAVHVVAGLGRVLRASQSRQPLPWRPTSRILGPTATRRRLLGRPAAFVVVLVGPTARDGPLHALHRAAGLLCCAALLHVPQELTEVLAALFV